MSTESTRAPAGERQEPWYVRRPLLPAALIATLFALLRVPTLALAPLGFDSWRETDVLMVGRNFCRERAPLWLPRIDARGDTSGITGMEFPLLNWLQGQAACLGVEQVLAGRVLTLLFAVVAILCVVRLGTRLRDARTGVLAGVFFATSPLVWYYGRGLQPDVPSLALALLALVLVDRAVTPEGVSWRFGLGSALALALGTLVKLPVIVFALPAVVLVVQRLGWKGLLRAPLTWVYGALVVGPTVAWYAYARGLQARHGLYHFFLGKPWRELVEDWGRGAFYESIFLKKLFDAYAFPLVSVAALLTLLVAWRRLAPWLRALGLATLAYFFLAGKHAEHHFYYGIPATPLLALAAADGVSRLVERLSRPLAARLLMGTLVLGALGYAHVRTRHMYAAPEAVATAERARGTLDAALAPDAKVALFSHADPTLLWFLDRRGWLVPPVDDPAAWFRASTVRPEALVVDPRRIDAAKRAALAEAFREAGYEPLLAEGPALWVRRPRQGS